MDRVPRHAQYQRHRREVLGRIIGKLAVEAGCNRQPAGRAHQDRVTVGGGLRHALGAHHAARARHVFNHGRVAERPAHAFGDDACGKIGRTARREGHDDPHGLRRVALRMRDPHGHQRHSEKFQQLSHRYTPLVWNAAPALRVRHLRFSCSEDDSSVAHAGATRCFAVARTQPAAGRIAAAPAPARFDIVRHGRTGRGIANATGRRQPCPSTLGALQ